MRIFLVLTCLLFINCWPFSITRTIKCNIEPNSCAELNMMRKGYNYYEIISQNDDGSIIKVKFYNISIKE